MAEFKSELESKIVEVENVIKKFLPEEEGYQKTVLEAMNYSMLAGGKRLRPLMMLESFKMSGGTDTSVVEPFMAAIEMIHNYSLVHDDLPAMDNDDYRRGRKTTHKVYGAGMATLAGDGLLNYAFETAMKSFDVSSVDEHRVIKALRILAQKAGIYGMVGGQCADIVAEGKNSSSEEEIIFIHEHKTAAMIESSLMIGAVLAGADDETVKKLEKTGSNVGIAFQIQDDILDVIGDEEKLGKPVGSDEKNEKTTYVRLHGVDNSSEEVRRLSEEALEIIKSVSSNSGFMCELVESLISRDR
ncbi:MAG: polyprenyl synthetase family protein [Butyrivibrio sp.]|nr:polyprenyl synthetase family protein [Butyrivibrio sp.]